ncbi:hypothetical protein [Rhodoplanes sp. Z2-YC6860]|uniref:hypothetical protein n=1 Tax=Rhodoplanes sp. Z2-YC6860 TaxID=674703 RepID=UPI00078DF819|nr:hypothetical protein [Rhodoplanes sp. Z2-YC6860]AMN39043.1 LacI family regulatory protein [Rhodoplanes sp. Z2-YC6860]
MTITKTKTSATVTVRVPLKLAVRGGRKTIIGDFRKPATRTRFDDSITKAIARAYRWRSLIEYGEYSSITELAKAEGVNQSYACRILRLTNLAPDIVAMILDQRGLNLTLVDLMQPFPSSWIEQRLRWVIDAQSPLQG